MSLTQIETGNKVRVIEDVWDDHRGQSWSGWEGIVESTQSSPPDPYNIFVFFPRSRGAYRHYDFLPSELEVIA